MAKQKYRRPGSRILWNEELKIKGYIHYTTLGLPQIFQYVQLENLNIEQNSRLSRFFESNYYYVLWWHSNGLYHCSKDQVIKIINEMGYFFDSECNSDDIFSTADIMIIGKDFENSDILYFDHNDNIGFYQKCGRIVVHPD